MMLFSDPSGEIRREAPQISFLDHGFLFGDSLYEVVRSYNRRVLGWDEHIARLVRGGDKIGISIRDLLRELEDRAVGLFKALDQPHAALRVIVTRGIGKLHIDPRTCQKPLVYMAAWPLQLDQLQNPIKLWVSKIHRNPLTAMDPSIKSGNYLNSVLAFKEAVEAGFDDAVMLNPDGEVTELTTSNIGWIKGGQIYTPQLETGILHGITRGFLLQAATVQQGNYTMSDLFDADEVFALSTFKEIVPVTELKSWSGEAKVFSFHEKTHLLHKELSQFIDKKLKTERIIY